MADDPRVEVRGRSLLLVDDDAVFREQLGRAFRARGYDVRTAADYYEGLSYAISQPPELAILDMRMPGRSGLELAQALGTVCPSTRILLLTGTLGPTAPGALIAAGIAYLSKPADADEILAALGLE